MSRLMRPCLDCKRTVRGKPRCADCQRDRDRRYDQRKAQRRPDLHNNWTERQRRAAAVADHRAIVGDWCPGWTGQPAHPSADLTADHVREVAKGGQVHGRLVVRCRSCNAARSAHLARRALSAFTRGPLPPKDDLPRPAYQPDFLRQSAPREFNSPAATEGGHGP